MLQKKSNYFYTLLLRNNLRQFKESVDFEKYLFFWIPFNRRREKNPRRKRKYIPFNRRREKFFSTLATKKREEYLRNLKTEGHEKSMEFVDRRRRK